MALKVLEQCCAEGHELLLWTLVRGQKVYEMRCAHLLPWSKRIVQSGHTGSLEGFDFRIADASLERHLRFPSLDDSRNRDSGWVKGDIDDLYRRN